MYFFFLVLFSFVIMVKWKAKYYQKLLLATAALLWWQQPDKHLHNHKASKEYYTPPLQKVDQLFNEHHIYFILVEYW